MMNASTFWNEFAWVSETALLSHSHWFVRQTRSMICGVFSTIMKSLDVTDLQKAVDGETGSKRVGPLERGCEGRTKLRNGLVVEMLRLN